MLKKILKSLKSIIKGDQKSFANLCKINQLQLDYSKNKAAFPVLKAIFQDREYSDYFPFYQKVTIVDIGAHYGYFSLFAKNNTHSDSTIITIEPDGKNFAHLQQNLKDNACENVKAFNFAVGGEAGEAQLFSGDSVNHSLVKAYALLHEKGDSVAVEVKTLEAVILENGLEKIDFLKLDCEGAEYAILENMSKAVFDKIGTISMEFHDMKNVEETGERILEILALNGFEIVKYAYDRTAFNLNYGKIIGRKGLS